MTAKKLTHLSSMTKDDLITMIAKQHAYITRLQTTINNKNSQVRHMRIRMLKIRRDVDYLLCHPFSVATNSNKRKTDLESLKAIVYKRKR